MCKICRNYPLKRQFVEQNRLVTRRIFKWYLGFVFRELDPLLVLSLSVVSLMLRLRDSSQSSLESCTSQMLAVWAAGFVGKIYRLTLLWCGSVSAAHPTDSNPLDISCCFYNLCCVLWPFTVLACKQFPSYFAAFLLTPGHFFANSGINYSASDLRMSWEDCSRFTEPGLVCSSLH